MQFPVTGFCKHEKILMAEAKISVSFLTFCMAGLHHLL